MKKKILLLIFAIIFHSSLAYAELWKITAYCSCRSCCGSGAKGITASGKLISPGMVACNWLPFGTIVEVAGKKYIVEDRGAKSLFGSKTNHIKHLDIYIKSHAEAKKFGVKYLEVKIK